MVIDFLSPTHGKVSISHGYNTLVQCFPETRRFSPPFPAKSGIPDFAPGYSNKMTNLLFQYNSLYPWISWEAGASETHQAFYD